MSSLGWVIIDGVLTFSGGISIASGVLKLADGAVGAPSLSYVSEPGFGWYRIGTSNMGLSGNSGKTIFGISSDGSIQMSNPSVNGGNATTVIQLDGSSLFRIAAGINATGKIVAYNGITTAGWGISAVYGSGRSNAQTAAVPTVATYTVGGSDGSFEISGNVNITTLGSGSFSLQVSYTDESNAARTASLQLVNATGSAVAFTANAAGPWTANPIHIRAKASTAITVLTQAAGTYTGCTFNVEGNIRQIA